jgi:hypothetical protein
MRPITYYTDSTTARSFAHVYGDRLENLSQPERMFVMLTLASSLFYEQSIENAICDVDPETDINEELCKYVREMFTGQDEQTLLGMIQAIAMTLEVPSREEMDNDLNALTEQKTA